MPVYQSSPYANAYSKVKVQTPVYNPPTIQRQSIPGQFNNLTNSYNAPLPSQGRVLGASTSSGGSTAQAPYQPASYQTSYNDIQQQTNTGNNQIDSDYEDYVRSLDSQAGDVRGQGGIAEEKARNAANEQTTAIGREQTQADQGFNDRTQQVNKQSQSAMQQARDMYRQMQQQNIAQLSASGLSSSSVNEALAEKLGTETMRRINGITGSRDEVLQNISKEQGNIKSYLQEKLTNVQNELSTTINSIQQNVMAQINQLNNSKQVAASDRANKRAQLLSQAQSSIAQLTGQAQDFAQQLQLKMQERQQRLTEAATLAQQEQQRFNQELPQLTAMMSGTNLNGGAMAPQQTGYVQRRPEDQFDFAQYGL